MYTGAHHPVNPADTAGPVDLHDLPEELRDRIIALLARIPASVVMPRVVAAVGTAAGFHRRNEHDFAELWLTRAEQEIDRYTRVRAETAAVLTETLLTPAGEPAPHLVPAVDSLIALVAAADVRVTLRVINQPVDATETRGEPSPPQDPPTVEHRDDESDRKGTA